MRVAFSVLALVSLAEGVHAQNCDGDAVSRMVCRQQQQLSRAAEEAARNPPGPGRFPSKLERLHEKILQGERDMPSVGAGPASAGASESSAPAQAAQAIASFVNQQLRDTRSDDAIVSGHAESSGVMARLEFIVKPQALAQSFVARDIEEWLADLCDGDARPYVNAGLVVGLTYVSAADVGRRDPQGQQIVAGAFEIYGAKCDLRDIEQRRAREDREAAERAAAERAAAERAVAERAAAASAQKAAEDKVAADYYEKHPAEAAALRGQQASLRNDFASALPAYEEALRLAPESLAYRESVAYLLVKLGRYAAAIQQYELLTRREPTNPFHHMALAESLAETRQTTAAVAEADKALSLSGTSAEMLRRRAAVLDKLNPGQPDPVMLARGSWEKGQKAFQDSGAAAAVPLYSEAVRLQPENPEYRGALGYALMSLQQCSVAVVHLQKAVELKPGDAWGHMNLSRCLAATGQKEGALREADRAVELAPDNNLIASQRRTVVALFQTRTPVALPPVVQQAVTRAAAKVKAPIDSTPATGSDSKFTYYRQAQDAWDRKDYRAAARLYTQAVRLSEAEGGDVDDLWRYSLALALERTGQPAAAIVELSKSIKLGAFGFMALARSLAEIGEREAALIAADRAVELDAYRAQERADLVKRLK